MMLLWVFNVQDVDNRCGDSHWRAANNHGRKAAKLDETGLEIAGQNKMKLVENMWLIRVCLMY